MKYSRSNKEAAQLLRQFRISQQRGQELREPEGAVNQLRHTSDQFVGSDSVTVVEGEAGDSMWGEGNWGLGEWAVPEFQT